MFSNLVVIGLATSTSFWTSTASVDTSPQSIIAEATDEGHPAGGRARDSTTSRTQQPDRIAAEIRELGAVRVLRRLYADPAAWDNVLDGIATGSAQWLDVAASLVKYADAGSAHDLSIAVGDALEAAPERVLELLKETSAVGDVCGDIGPGSSRGDVLERLRRREHSVCAVKRNDLQLVRKQCLDAIEDLRAAAEELTEY